jgi:asparagine synthase (glutamine-hydrolysing)
MSSLSGIVAGGTVRFESGGAVRDPASGLVAAIEGRIDDVRELRQACLPASAEETSPAALVLAAYRKWGETCPRHILGEYAIAVWEPARQQFFCARDSAGVVPFFYAELPDGSLRFSTNATAILADPAVPRDTDSASMVDFLIGRGAFLPHRSPWSAVARLEAGQSLTFGRAGQRLTRYWSVFDEDVPEFRDFGEAVIACSTALQDAILDRVEGAEKAGISLSGGWDSGALFAIWQSMRRAGLTLAEPWFYTYYFPSPESDERAEVHQLLAGWPADGQFAPLDPDNGFDHVAQHSAQTGMPEAASGWRWLSACASAGRAAGVSTIVVGEAGNEVFQSSILRPADLARAGRWRAAHRQAGAWAADAEAPVSSFLWPFVIRPSVSAALPGVWSTLRNTRRLWQSPSSAWPYLSDSASALALDMTAARETRSRRRLAGRSLADWDKRTALQRWCSELFPIPPFEGVRFSAPFLDRRVVTCALSALTMETEAASTRRLLAATVERTIGSSFRGRHAHYTNWLESMLRAAFQRDRELFRAPLLVELGIADRTRLQQYLDRFQAGEGGSLPVLWRLAALEAWARHFLRGRAGQ